MPVHITEEYKHIADFLEKHPVGVLATSDASGKPSAATVYYKADDQLNIYFITKDGTAKHRNLQANSQASFVVYEAKTQTTVQANGTVELIEDAGRFQDIFASILQSSVATSGTAVPPIAKLTAGSYVAYRLRPKMVRMAVYIRPDEGNFERIFEVVVGSENDSLEY